jgi:hypothetical protein
MRVWLMRVWRVDPSCVRCYCSCRKLVEFSCCDVDCITDRSVLALVSCGTGIVPVRQHSDTNDDGAVGLTPFQAAGEATAPEPCTAYPNSSPRFPT